LFIKQDAKKVPQRQEHAKKPSTQNAFSQAARSQLILSRGLPLKPTTLALAN